LLLLLLLYRYINEQRLMQVSIFTYHLIITDLLLLFLLKIIKNLIELLVVVVEVIVVVVVVVFISKQRLI
jgi:hypothetical protein